MSNTVTTDENNIVVIQVIGDQTLASVELMGRETSVALTQLRAKRKPCLVLDDLTQMAAVDEGGRKKVVELGKRLDYDRLAMLGKPNALLRLGANLMFRAIGRGDKMRYFEDRQAAVDWLKAPLEIKV